MDTAWLEVFREVARRGSFTAAARALGFTQSAVSRQISALEADVDARLFDRLARGVRLTDQGRLVHAHAEAVLDRLRAARRDLAGLADLSAGRLRIGAFPTADTALVPRAIAAFRSAYPNVAVSLAEGLTREHVASLRADDIDLAIVSGYDGAAPELATVDLQHLIDDPILVALARRHPLARRRRLRLAELVDENWIAGSATVEDTLIGACLKAGFQPRIGFVVRGWTDKQGFVAAGLGITLMPALAATAIRGDIALASLHPDDAPVRAVYAATRRGLAGSPAVAGFLPYLREAVTALRQETNRLVRQPRVPGPHGEAPRSRNMSPRSAAHAEPEVALCRNCRGVMPFQERNAR